VLALLCEAALDVAALVELADEAAELLEDAGVLVLAAGPPAEPPPPPPPPQLATIADSVSNTTLFGIGIFIPTLHVHRHRHGRRSTANFKWNRSLLADVNCASAQKSIAAEQKLKRASSPQTASGFSRRRSRPHNGRRSWRPANPTLPMRARS
jgi:hypothetical protein